MSRKPVCPRREREMKDGVCVGGEGEVEGIRFMKRNGSSTRRQNECINYVNHDANENPHLLC